MTAFEAFMTGLIDYAGLFPPARLDLEPALRNYARYREGRDAWMLGRFILPAARLSDLKSYAGLFAKKSWPIPLSVLIQGPGDLETMDAQVFETRLPLGEKAKDFLDAFAGKTKGRPLFLEDPAGNDASVIEAIASSRGADPLGYKLRCGGLEPAAFPSIERVARVIEACRDFGVPLKCTAGLHRPLRHAVPEENAVHHGFFNLFGAALLAAGLNLSRPEIEACLKEEEAEAFRFENDRFAWKDLSLPVEAIKKLRAERVIGFGSCSFDEPRADLVALDLLQAHGE